MLQAILKLNEENLILSAHDISEGGLFTCLLESGMNRNLGFELALPNEIRSDAFLFGEAQGRIIVSVVPDLVPDFEEALGFTPYTYLGDITAKDILVQNENWGSIEDWKHKYDTALETLMQNTQAQ